MAAWDLKTKLVEAAKRAIPLLPEDMREEFSSLFTPESIATTAAILTAWVASHAFGIGEAADIALLLVGLGMLGWQTVHVARDLWNFAAIASQADSEADLDRAALHLARAVAVIGVTAFVALLTKGAGKGVKSMRRGKIKGKADIWWEAEDFGLNYSGTAIPRGFTLKVGSRTYYIKPNATKHMADHAHQNAGIGAYASQTEFPISSLAAALEQADAQGRLGPLLRNELPRLGTPEKPFRIGDWELSLEFVSGKLEVFHAVYKP